MKIGPLAAWRPALVVGGVIAIAGGAMHPDGTMAEMLADPDWVPSHVLFTAGMALVAVGLFDLSRQPGLSARTRRWTRFAFFGGLLEVVEGVMHTASVVDARLLAGGEATPVLTVHLWMAALFWPIFAFGVAGLVIAAWRKRDLGSPWIAWIGLVGAAAHGLVMALVFGLGIEEAGILFPMVAVLLTWFVLVGFWPVRSRVSPRAPDPADVLPVTD